MAMSAAAAVALARLLEASGVERPVEDVLAVLEGVAAAPVGFRPDAWLDLIAPPDALELRDELRSLEAEIAAARPPDASGLRCASPGCAQSWPSSASTASSCRDRRASQRISAGRRPSASPGSPASPAPPGSAIVLRERAAAVRRRALHRAGAAEQVTPAVRAPPPHRRAAGALARGASCRRRPALGFDPKLTPRPSRARAPTAAAKARRRAGRAARRTRSTRSGRPRPPRADRPGRRPRRCLCRRIQRRQARAHRCRARRKAGADVAGR